MVYLVVQFEKMLPRDPDNQDIDCADSEAPAHLNNRQEGQTHHKVKNNAEYVEVYQVFDQELYTKMKLLIADLQDKMGWILDRLSNKGRLSKL
jgi:hypothetical protein